MKIVSPLRSCSAFLLSALLCSCALPTMSVLKARNPDFVEYFITESVVNIAWEIEYEDPVEEFNIYFSPHEEGNWNLLESIESTESEYTLYHSIIGDGRWDFAVSSVDETGAESPIHSSLDQNADPDTGWYVLWLE